MDKQQCDYVPTPEQLQGADYHISVAQYMPSLVLIMLVKLRD